MTHLISSKSNCAEAHAQMMSSRMDVKASKEISKTKFHDVNKPFTISFHFLACKERTSLRTRSKLLLGLGLCILFIEHCNQPPKIKKEFSCNIDLIKEIAFVFVHTKSYT